jgi:hypothetical protein
MTRTRMALILPAVGLAGVLGLAGCGAAAPTPSDVADEAAALQQVGFDTGLQAAPSPSASASSDAKSKAGNRGKGRKAVRKYLNKNTLHGEVTVQGKDGTKTILVQRGSITAVSGSSLTVKSTDGFTLTWKLADKARIVQDKKKVEVSALKTGEQVGVAGTKDSSSDNARLVAVK